jgi:TetR/AcrR family transcriptional regulator, transcriptional repressor for nem operon
MSQVNAQSGSEQPRRRGRPPVAPADQAARKALMRAGLVHLTERGYSSVGVDEILRTSGVAKGSFYYHFGSKAAFGSALIDAYHAYFAAKLAAWFERPDLAPLDRLRGFIADAELGMAQHGFRRGCLIGNLGQEMASLPPEFSDRLIAVLEDWQHRTAACLRLAQEAGQIPAHHAPDELAAFFWIGWEGAVLRAKLERKAEPLRQFADGFLRLVTH